MANPTILVVDDDWLNRELIEGLLSVFDYQVLLANGGDAALKILAHHQPDLIVMDVRMPEMDGYDLCQLIKSQSHTAHIPIIMITTLDVSNADRQKIADVGAVDYISRMTLTKVLIEKIEAHLPLKTA